MSYYSPSYMSYGGMRTPAAAFVPDNGYRPLESSDVQLKIQQQPVEGLIAFEGKEKARKAIDPPPFVRMDVTETADPNKIFLQSPYLFMACSLVSCDSEETALTHDGKCGLTGTLVSSLHRLRNVDNKDGGYFVFGDLSGKVPGKYRLHFRLYDMRKQTPEGPHGFVFLKSVLSEPFKISLPKDFNGLSESTHLSRSFSDQGVRLRLRKEPRTKSKKRGYSEYLSDGHIKEEDGRRPAPQRVEPVHSADPSCECASCREQLLWNF